MSQFLFDDYFSDPEDMGVEVIVEHRGKLLPFRLKRSLSLDERQRATSAGIDLGLDSAGVPTIQKMDQAAYTKELLLAALKSWPFAYTSGQSVPINRKTVSQLDSALADKLVVILMGRKEAQDTGLAPFAKKSGAD